NIAEQVKIQHAQLGGEIPKKTVHFRENKKDYIFEPEDIAMITEARVEELLELVDKELRKIHKSQKLPGGVVIVGGMANLPGIADFAKEKRQLAARIGKLQPIGGLADTVSDTSFTTAVGLVLLDMMLLPAENNSAHSVNEKVFGAMDGMFKKLRRRMSN